MHKDTFNSDFYVVAATIIPLLYLALTLQGQTYERLINRARKAVSRGVIIPMLLIPVFSLLSLGIVTAGILGEWLSIWALYERSASHKISQAVLVCLVVLLLAVATGPVLRWASPWEQGETENQAAKKAAQTPGDNSEESLE
jgi:hypothetical protein